jgi:23S rRNA (guanosine2251-2'-O)-methyltransferase
MEAPKNVFELDLREPITFVIGSEDNGISPAIMKACDEVCKIPMAGDFESLNVSVATGMVLYEAMRQKLRS